MADTITQIGLTALAQGIASHLSGSWHVEPLAEPRATYPSRHIHCDDGRSFYIHTENGDRISVHGNWPTTADGRTQWPSQYDGVRPVINVSTSKTSIAIAKEIERRFLPDYTKTWSAMKEHADSHDEHARKTKANADRILADDPTLHTPERSNGVPTDNSEITIYCGSNSYGYQMRVSGDSVRFEHFSCPIDVARRVIVELRKTRDE